MIAKITRGSSARGLAAYLHGPGKGTEHRDLVTGLPGGRVITSNIPGVTDNTDGKRWSRWMDRAISGRSEIKDPIWHCSLNLAPEDTALTAQQWTEAVPRFLIAMRVPSDQPWVAVQHDDRSVHVVVSRVNDEGTVWHARNDRRAAQKARQRLETDYQLTPAPTKKAALPLPSPAIGEHEIDGKTWRVREDSKGRLRADRLGQDGKWRHVRGGIQTLQWARLRQDPDLLKAFEARETAAASNALPPTEAVRPRAPGSGPKSGPYIGPTRGRGSGRGGFSR